MARLTEEEKKEFMPFIGDPEAIHGEYDKFILNRLASHEPDLVEDLDEFFKDVTFWYA